MRLLMSLVRLLSLDKLKKKQKLIWIKPWIQRRNALGASSTLTRELASEDPDSYCNFFRINEDMFNILLKKVVLKYII